MASHTHSYAPGAAVRSPSQPAPAVQDASGDRELRRSVLSRPNGATTGQRQLDLQNEGFEAVDSGDVDLGPTIDLDGYRPENVGRQMDRGLQSKRGSNRLRRGQTPARNVAFRQRQDDRNPLDKTCDDFRTQLLDNPITSIELNISPKRSEQAVAGQSRAWTTADGTVWATGTLVDLRHGYAVIQTETGQVKIPYARLSDPDWAAIAQQWQLPLECGIEGTYEPRLWAPQTFTWTASSLCHKPLYFENIQLERYGHSHGPFLQPVHSAAHFFVSLVSWPYQTTIHPPNECQYALGFYRPGSCAPWLRYPIPFSTLGTQYHYRAR